MSAWAHRRSCDGEGEGTGPNYPWTLTPKPSGCRYGDIEATTRIERVFACVGMLVGGFVFSNIIASMSDSLTSMDLDMKEREHKMEKVTSFINVRARCGLDRCFGDCERLLRMCA